MQKYQLTVLINEKVSEDSRKETLESIKKSFGSLIKEDLWGIRSLSYDIKHMNRAYFAHFEFEAEPTSVITLDKNIRLNEDIIRYLIVKIFDKRLKNRSRRKKEESKEAARPSEGGETEKVEAEVETKSEEKRVKSKKVNNPINK